MELNSFRQKKRGGGLAVLLVVQCELRNLLSLRCESVEDALIPCSSAKSIFFQMLS